MPNQKTRTKRADLAKQLIAGTQKHLANVPSMTIASGTYTPSQIESQLQQLATLRANVETAKAALKDSLVAEEAQAPALSALQDAFIAYVKAITGNVPSVLTDFGIPPKKKPAPRTAEQLAAAKAKRDATRKARGTKGSKQKKDVKGAVTGVTIVPTTAAAAAPSPNPPATTAAAPSVGAPQASGTHGA